MITRFLFSFLGCFLLLNLSGCFKPCSPSYKKLYAHLEERGDFPQASWESEYFLVIYVNARHLDYTNNYSFLKTVTKHPSDRSRNRDFGHAWVYLQGVINGEKIYVYGGHSGERGLFQAKYFDGIMNYLDFGYANPTLQQLHFPCYEPNPVKYLGEVQKDGYFEWGSGGHHPTFSAKIDLTPLQFEAALDFIQKYDYQNYSLGGNQCSSFAAQIASLAGVDLESQITLSLDKNLYLDGECIRFWKDSFYSQLTISSPDIIERSLMKAVREGKAEYVPCLHK